MPINYNHSQNRHTLKGAQATLSQSSALAMSKSMLDVGCGAGTWLRAALDLGISDVFGIDGVDIPSDQLLVDPRLFKQCDLTAPVNLGRKFEIVLCLEVGEHLDARSAAVLIGTLARHSDNVVFSAACPGQPGQNHVNCQWPEYWQELFNRQGFACEDSLRWQIWSNKDIEPWYRQNLFTAVKDVSRAGKEDRIKPVVHPDVNSWIFPERERFESHIHQIEDGRVAAKWYFKAMILGLTNKIKRHI